MLTHRNALTFVDWCSSTLGVSANDRFSNHAPLHFDLSVFDLYVAASAGATVVLVEESTAFLARHSPPSSRKKTSRSGTRSRRRFACSPMPLRKPDRSVPSGRSSSPVRCIPRRHSVGSATSCRRLTYGTCTGPPRRTSAPTNESTASRRRIDRSRSAGLVRTPRSSP